MTRRVPYRNAPLVVPLAAARWAWVKKVSRDAYAVHRLSRVVGPGTGDDVLSDPKVEEVQGVTVCGVDGRLVPAGGANGARRFAGIVCAHCRRRLDAMAAARGQ